MTASRGVSRAARLLALSLGLASLAGAQSAAQDREVGPLELAHVFTRTEGTGVFGGRSVARLGAGTITFEGADEGVAMRGSWREREQGPGATCRFEENASASASLDLVPAVSTSLEDGALVRLGEREYHVARDVELEVATTRVPAILLEASGDDRREHEEEVLEVQWSEVLWFDLESGAFLRRERTSILEGRYGAYEERERTWVTRSAALPEAASTPLFPVADCRDPRDERAPPWLRVGLPVATVLGLFVAAGRLRARRDRAR